jgi:hypothetical protein
MHRPLTFGFILLQSAIFGAGAALAHDIHAKSDAKVPPAFDITGATASTDGRLATFAMEVTGEAGSQKPQKVGKLQGAKVDAYVWPTSSILRRSASPRARAFWRWPSPRIRTSTIPRCSTRTATAIRPMTAPTGIRTG